MKKPTKSDIAAVARKIWHYREEAREGRETVERVLEVYGKRLAIRARNAAIKRELERKREGRRARYA